MTATLTTKEQALERIEAGWASWEALLADVGDERMEQPGATSDWTFKDVAAHLNAWRELTLARLEAAARGEAPAPPPWPADLDEESPEGTDEINAWIYERNCDRAAGEVIAETREHFQRLRAIVAALSPEDLFAPGRFTWLGDYPLSAVLEGSFEHLEEHELMIREWLKSDQSPGDQRPSSQEPAPRSTT